MSLATCSRQLALHWYAARQCQTSLQTATKVPQSTVVWVCVMSHPQRYPNRVGMLQADHHKISQAPATKEGIVSMLALHEQDLGLCILSTCRIDANL